MACYRYIELNPVRAGLVEKSEDYIWSSYHANALGEVDSLITPHSVYLRLGGTKIQRQIVYKDLFKEPLGENLGGEKFRQQIE